MSEPVRPDLNEIEARVNYSGSRDAPLLLGPADWRAVIAYARSLEAQLALAQERADLTDALPNLEDPA